MPTYEYKCPKCEKTFIISHTMEDHTQHACTECVTRLQRVFRIAGIQFKGSGWAHKDRKR